VQVTDTVFFFTVVVNRGTREDLSEVRGL